MQKTNYILLTISYLSLFLLLGCYGEGNTIGPPYHCYSRTISDSKKNGVFQFEVVADKSILTFDKAYKLEIKTAWVENPWSRQALIFGKSPFWKNDSSYQLIMNLNIDSSSGQKSNKYFYFVGNKPLDTFICYYSSNYFSHSTDTIKVPLYRETSSKLPSKKERKAFDTLTFVKRITSN